MAAITWRNVDDTGTDAALRSLMAASAGVGNSFGALQGVVRDVEAADKVAFEQSKEKNTNAFLDALQSRYTTPEALQAAIASGETEAFRQSFGNRINSAATRGAADTRLANLRQQDVAGRQFENQRTDDRDQTFLSRIQAGALAGDPEAKALMAEVSARNQGRAAQTMFEAEKALFGQTVERNKETRAGEKHVSDLQTAATQRDASRASAAASYASAAASNVRTQLGQLELKDAQEGRQFLKAIQGDINDHQKQTAMDKQRINEIARANPGMATVDKNGELNLSRMSTANKEAFNALLQTQGLSLNTFTGSDTARADAMIQKLHAAGAPLAVIEKVKAGAPSWYNTTGSVPLGNDAATKARENAQAELNAQHVVDAAGGIPLRSGDFTEAMKIIGPSIPKKDGDKVKAAISEYFQKGGVEFEGVKRYLPANTIAQIVQNQEDFWPGFVPLNSAGRDTLSALKAAEKNFEAKLSGVATAEIDKKLRSTNTAAEKAGSPVNLYNRKTKKD